MLHLDQQRETIAHILIGCPAYKGLYIAQHDCIVALTVKELCNTANFTSIYDTGSVKTDWFSLTQDQRVTLGVAINHSANMPDLILTL